MAWATPPTAVTGAIATASDQNILRDDLLFVKEHIDSAVQHGSITALLGIMVVNGVTADFTIPYWNYHLHVNCNGANRSITLPTAVGNAGRFCEVRKTDVSGYEVHIYGAGAQAVNGDRPFKLYAYNDSATLRSDGANVQVV